MSLDQLEADRLLSMPKVFSEEVAQVDFPKFQTFEAEYALHGLGNREQFSLDLERGNRKRARLKFQTRSRKIYILARIDIEGRPHRNPVDAPHRPNQRLVGTHIHLYREGFADRVAYLPEDLPQFIAPAANNDVSWLVAFLRFCNVVELPTIQEGI
ncbi:MAG TPA: hypothetical protein PKY38_08395 [Opitutaceae bacterium]|nr:hypothetical protein [Opitutaceae bacterium]